MTVETPPKWGHIIENVAPVEVAMSDLARLIETSLADSGQASQANAFRRWLSRLLSVSTQAHNVTDVKSNLSGILGQVRSHQAMTISPHNRREDAVVVISLAQLANELGALAFSLEQHPGADARNPMSMLARVDQIGDAGNEAMEVDVWRSSTHHQIAL